MGLSPRQPTNECTNQRLQRRGLKHLAGDRVSGPPSKPAAAWLQRHPRPASAAQIQAAKLAGIFVRAVRDAGLTCSVSPSLCGSPSLLRGDDSDSHLPICVAGFL